MLCTVTNSIACAACRIFQIQRALLALALAYSRPGEQKPASAAPGPSTSKQ